MRFLVWDDAVDRLIGLFALGDPVFNLGVRDQFVMWSTDDRAERLVNVMDAYVLGAVPPYSLLLGGKLIASLVRTTEVRDSFQLRYGESRGIISKEKKRASLVMVTTTSALGRSAIYNRLKLNGTEYMRSVGFTGGYGHFHIDDELFELVRMYLRYKKHPYLSDYRFGGGPNWKFRSIRAALELLGIDRILLHHGLKREVFVCQLAQNAREVLRGETAAPDYSDLLTVAEVSEFARERWLCPRALRAPTFSAWSRQDTVRLFESGIRS